ncbi:MAG: Fe-S cluster assembly protein HesB [Frankiales bacterium]|jgi:uncharacterized HhH-GPD family protein|nr:Fe-S cluster assembly protein HesB [Frankiales bacterium]
MIEIRIAQDPEADKLLSMDPFALAVGMTLDQQFPMEAAFKGPHKLVTRLGLDRLDPAVVAGYDPVAFADLAATPPAIHRYGRSMAGRIQKIAQVVVDEYDGDISALWTTAKTGQELFDRLVALPGWGEMKAKIFIALLGKQLKVRPKGWREAAGSYGDEGATRSVADVVDEASLQKVRDFKKAAKAAAKSATA